jgi:hypothetical protein
MKRQDTLARSDFLTWSATALFDGRETIEAEVIVSILCSLAARRIGPSVIVRGKKLWLGKLN